MSLEIYFKICMSEIHCNLGNLGKYSLDTITIRLIPAVPVGVDNPSVKTCNHARFLLFY